MIDPLPCGTFAKFTIPTDHTDLIEICSNPDDKTSCYTMGTYRQGLANVDYIWYIFAKEVGKNLILFDYSKQYFYLL